MKRLRFFRVLLPVLLVVLGGLLVFSLTPRDRIVGRPAREAGRDDPPRAQGLEFIELKGASRSVSGLADLITESEDGRLHLEGIRGLEIERPTRGPLVVDASRGDGEGGARQRLWRFEDEVVLRDPEAQLRLSLPSLEIDEVRGEARATGDVRLQGPQLEGQASELVYGLAGQPGALLAPRLESADGARLAAQRAILVDGIRDVEFRGAVEVERSGASLFAERLRVVRSDGGGVRRANAGDGVSGSWPLADGSIARLRSRRADLEWAEDGALAAAALSGRVRLERGADWLEAGDAEAERRTSGAWRLRAWNGAHVKGTFGLEGGELLAEEIVAHLGADRRLSSAEAWGDVRFEGDDVRGDATRASLETRGEGDSLQLFSDDARKAHLARGSTRVAADWIRTDLAGSTLSARGRVEASLLPEPGQSSAPNPTHLFRTDEAIHFVSERLDGKDAGRRLEFGGTVRGYQGERNLAADSIVVDQAGGRLEARGSVASRIPRAASGAGLTTRDFVQIVAERLDYDDRERRATYGGDVRLDIEEGWLEATGLEIDLGGGGEVRELRASGEVRLELHTRGESGAANPPVAGLADRVVYLPGERTVMLYGDRAPASVSQAGESRATTTGRALRYRLDLGTLEVEAGEQGPARIRTSGGTP